MVEETSTLSVNYDTSRTGQHSLMSLSLLEEREAFYLSESVPFFVMDCFICTSNEGEWLVD